MDILARWPQHGNKMLVDRGTILKYGASSSWIFGSRSNSDLAIFHDLMPSGSPFRPWFRPNFQCSLDV